METAIGIGSEIGPFRVEALLGQGGMAQVYKAWHTGLGRYEAMKILPPEMTYDKSFTERFLNEARVSAGLRHPNIATVYTVGSTTDVQPYFTMELVEGINLAEALQAHGRPSVRDALAILQQIGGALDYAHSRGVIHRDVKPANILIENSQTGHWIVKVVDFGIARAQQASEGSNLTRAGMIVGTPEYMSPEQAGSGAPVDLRSDIYSLGIIAYEMFCGRPPFIVSPGDSALTVIMHHVRDLPMPPSIVDRSIPEHASAAIMQALAKDANYRFPSCAAFIAAIEGGPRLAPAQYVPPRPVSVPPRPVKKSLGMYWVIGVFVLLGIGLIAMSLLNRPHSGPEPPVDPPRPVVTAIAPDVTGMTESQARSFAAAKDEQVSIETVADDTVPSGHVVSQSPKPGGTLADGAPLLIRISKGPMARSPIRQSANYTRPAQYGGSDIELVRWLTPADVAERSPEELRIMRNSIYAHHGYLFHDAGLRAHFSQFGWYHPYSADQNVIGRSLSGTERHNAEMLKQVEDSLKHGGE